MGTWLLNDVATKIQYFIDTPVIFIQFFLLTPHLNSFKYGANTIFLCDIS